MPLWRGTVSGILFAEVIGSGGGIEACGHLEAIARLPVTGHRAWGALRQGWMKGHSRGLLRLRAFEDGARMARNAINACITFMLLGRRSMPWTELPAYLDQVHLYRGPTAVSWA